MRHSRLHAASALAILLALTGCGVGSITFSTYPNASMTVSPQLTSVAAGSSTSFTATVSNDPATPYWNLNSFYFVTSANSIGSLNGQASNATVTSATVTYTAPSTPPIYTNGTPSQQGTVQIVATEVTGLLQGIANTQTVAITTPTITAGILPTTASVALGQTQAFAPYAVGNVNNAVTLQVNGVTGGSSTVGTISATGLYTAPATLPMSGSTVTITVISVADSTKTATAVVTLH